MSDQSPACWLCGRPLGKRVEWHHPLPKSRAKNRDDRGTVPVHPICHRAIHAHLSNADLARAYSDADALRAHPGLARFLGWVANKPADFHAPTHKKR
ncbi:HNH endonuclease [Sphingobium estronivorans]|uniref:HNH endonuclease n=1 Tax=Sphingobium estronivorans TaxID=1577690 RepID=UPI0012398CE7|nr:HNH endonuclease [Sphingobium estronivorans]